jgi:hypothetical protein
VPRAWARGERGDRARAHERFVAERFVVGGREHDDLGDGGDAGQRLAPKTQRRKPVQVVDAANLARGVALEG